jgi:hypothetical protein
VAFEFEAALVDSDTAAERLSFADHPDDQQHYLVIQRDEESADDVLPDMENVYVERDDQQFGGYGGIESVSLTNTRLTLRLTPRMTRQMGLHDTLSVGFQEDSFREVDGMVRLIFRGYESRVVRPKN